MELGVCGLHMRGQKLEHQLTDLKGSFLKACKSAPTYKLYAITDRTSNTCKPGMVYVGHGQGTAIDLEVWNLPVDNLGKFFQQITAPLGLGTVLLEDGSNVKGFICEGYVTNLADHAADTESGENGSNLSVKDITDFGSWRHFQAQQ